MTTKLINYLLRFISLRLVLKVHWPSTMYICLTSIYYISFIAEKPNRVDIHKPCQPAFITKSFRCLTTSFLGAIVAVLASARCAWDEPTGTAHSGVISRLLKK